MRSARKRETDVLDLLETDSGLNLHGDELGTSVHQQPILLRVREAKSRHVNKSLIAPKQTELISAKVRVSSRILVLYWLLSLFCFS